MNRFRFFAAMAAVAVALAGSAAGAPAPGVAEPAAPAVPPAPQPAVPPPASTPSPDAFYEGRLTIGEQALSAGRAAEAADDLRVASFGLLDRPEKLSECLVWLAVAQQRAGRIADAEATLRRFQAVQALFPSWGRLALAPEMKGEFEALARKRLPGLRLEDLRDAERRPAPAPAPPAAPSGEARPPTPPVAENPARPAAPPVVAPPVLRPAPVPVALENPPAPRPLAVRAAASGTAPAAPSASSPVAPVGHGFFDRELRTGRSVVFEIRPDQARLFVDGRYVGVSADWGGGGGRPFPLASGEHAVRAVLPGYRELRLRVIADPSDAPGTIAAAELARLERRSFRRIPRAEYVTAGRIAFAPELRGAEVAVDGEPTGAADRFTPSAPMLLTGPAVHDVVLSRPGRPARTIRILASPTAGSGLVVVRTNL